MRRNPLYVLFKVVILHLRSKNGLERGGTTDGRGRFFYRLGLFGKPLRLWALIMGLSTAPEPQTGLFR